ncbi:MAG: nickel pincer cofactor biosynthesis protein LarB [Nitrospirae bacterium]|nr:nickel pincer cofactor biosynthesis protein LarB [Nitrospirota bacterium]
MDRARIEKLLRRVRAGRTPVRLALEELRSLPFEDVGFAKVDTHRALRKGFPEVIWGAGKTAEQIVGLIRVYRRHGHAVLATRVDPDKAGAVRRQVPEMKYDPVARMLTLRPGPWKRVGRGVVAVVAAGTSDLPVAEEARLTAWLMGSPVRTFYDVGVAGIHRLFRSGPDLQRARVVIVVAGMEGALASVVGGVVEAPVIAVPTSVGYGANYGGLSALLAMLTCCAPGVAVVNIDNGFGAGYLAAVINRL